MNVTKAGGNLSFRNKLGYSFGTFGECIGYNFYYLFFIYFLTDVAGMSPVISGTIALLAVMWDAVTDPLIGYLSDRSENPKGKRRPWIKKFSIPLGIIVVVLFTNPGLVGTTQFAYFLVANILFWLIFTSVDIPYMVLGGEITRIDAERLNIRWMSTSFNYVGYGFAGYTLFIVAKFQDVWENTNLAWTATAVVMGIMIAFSFLVAYFSTKGLEPVVEPIAKADKINILKSIVLALKLKPYRYVLLYTVFFMAGIMLYTGDQVYLFMYNLGASDTQISNLYLGYAIMVVLISPLVGKLGKKIGNKNTLLISIVLSTLGFGVFRFLPLTMVSVWGILIACGIGVAGFFVISYAMIYDIADVSELKTGVNNEGVIVSFFSFAIKLATALGLWLLGVLLSFYHYDPDAETTNQVLNGIKDIGTIIPAVICGISVIFILKYSLTPANMKKLRDLKELKDQGQEIDKTVINKLL